MPTPIVAAVCRSSVHSFSKLPAEQVFLRAGLGVDGDAHQGVTVKHRSRVARDPTQPNLRQIHLIHIELFDELRDELRDALQAGGFVVKPGDLGENITTRGIALLALPTGTRLHLGADAVVEITGLRNPCAQLDAFEPGLMAAVLGRDERGRVSRKAGVMGVVRADGTVRPGDPIEIELPALPHVPLDCV